MLRRYPGTVMLAVQADGQRRVPESGGNWKQPLFTLSVDDQTGIFGFDLTRADAEAGPWLFVLREPMRGTQFGFDIKTADSPALSQWTDLTWDDVPMDRGTFAHASGTPPAPTGIAAGDPRWKVKAIDIAHIAFQRPFQVAFSPKRLLGDD